MNGAERRRREPASMCDACGFVMNCVIGFDDDRPPLDDDLACCAGCGYPFRRSGTCWLPLTRIDLVSMEADDLARLILFRRQLRDRAARRGPQPRPTLQ